MKKAFVWLIAALLLISIAAFAIAAESGNGSVSDNVKTFVQDFVQKRGIPSQDITNVSQVDFNSLPKEVNIKNVNDNNLAIYRVNYSANNTKKQVYVVTYSLEQLKSQGDLIVASDKRNFLDFGHPGTMKNIGFLETATGVETSTAKGYVMMRDGSITGISTNLEVIQSNPQNFGQIEIIVLKNGQPISFGNTISADTLGVKKDYDVQAKGTVNFQAGDVISVVAKGDSGVSWQDVSTLVEITTNS